MEGVTARDVMSRTFAGVSEGDDVEDVLELMVDERTDDVLVLRGSEPVGHVAATDLLETVTGEAEREEATVESIMRPAPDPIHAESDIADVLARLTTVDVDRLPVANGEEGLVGVITESDVIAAASTMISEPRTVDAERSDRLGSDAGGVAGTGQAAATDAASEAPGASPEQYANQSVCESCGTLSADLQVVNGQSICPECRDV